MSELDCDSEGYTINRCVICGVDMGRSNPRQYCRKWYCPEESLVDEAPGILQKIKEENMEKSIEKKKPIEKKTHIEKKKSIQKKNPKKKSTIKKEITKK